VLAHHPTGFAHRRVGRQRDGIADDPVGRALHLFDLAGLRVGGEVLVDDAEPALLRERDGEARFGRPSSIAAETTGTFTVDVSGHARAGVDLRRQDLAVGGNEQKVVVGDSELDVGLAHGDSSGRAKVTPGGAVST
jgi:hypothetical protein